MRPLNVKCHNHVLGQRHGTKFSSRNLRLSASSNRSPPAPTDTNGNGASAGLDFATFTFIVDDIVLPNGTTKMKSLGGGGSQTLWAYALTAAIGGHSPKIGLSAGVGDDLHTSFGDCLSYLQAMGTDISALLPVKGHKTPRAWQLFEEDGLRTQVWRVPVTPVLWQMLRPDVDSMPDHFKLANSFHLGIDPSNVASFTDMMAKLRALADSNYGLFSIEPYTHSNRTLTTDELSLLCTAGHVFSPNELEAECMLGRPKDARPTTAPPMSEAMFYVERLHEAGAPVVLLRRGPQGVVISSKGGKALRVPACSETRVVDTCGCGNACIGGTVRILQERASARIQAKGCSTPQAAVEVKLQFTEEDLMDAAIAGSVAASIMAEHLGMPSLPPYSFIGEATRRMGTLRNRVAVVV